MKVKKGYVIIDQKVYILDFHTKIEKLSIYILDFHTAYYTPKPSIWRLLEIVTSTRFFAEILIKWNK